MARQEPRPPNSPCGGKAAPVPSTRLWDALAAAALRRAITLAALAVSLAFAPAAALPATAAPRVVVLTLPGLRLEDLGDPQLPNLRTLASRSAHALMNTVTAAPFRGGPPADPMASAYLTVGLARRAAAPPLPDVGFAARALPDTYWQRLAQFEPTASAGPVITRPTMRVRVGLIAAADAHGGAEALLALTRPGSPLAAGSAGAQWLRRDSGRPYGVTADMDNMARGAARIAAKVDLLWLDPGDLQRASSYAFWCLPAVAAEHRRAALHSADHLLALLRTRGLLAGRSLLLVAPTSEPATARLAPLLWGDPSGGPALLASAATHTTGLIANTDVMPHLLTALAPSPPRASPLRRVPSPQPMAFLQQLQARSSRADRLRSATMPVVKAWLLLGILIAVIAARAGNRNRWRHASLLWPFAVPAAAIALGGLASGSFWPWAALALGAIAVACSRRLALPPLLGGWLLLTLLADLFLGSPILRWSPLGYSFSLGARYYGIGNEWMGYLVGAAILVGMGRSGVQAFRRSEAAQVLIPQHLDTSTPNTPVTPSPVTAALPSTLALLALAHPAWGANFGGALTAAVATAAVVWVCSGPRGRRVALALAVGLMLAVALVAVLDAARPPELQTHLGRLASEIRSMGLAPLKRVALGKLMTNLRIASGYWGFLLAAEVAACLWLSRTSRRCSSELRALLCAAGAALVFNDSGVIAAGLMLSLGPLLLPAVAPDIAPRAS